MCLVGLVFVVIGCGESDSITNEPATLPSRVEAVAARRADPAERFCDVSSPANGARVLTLPPLEGAPAPTDGWRWLNLWATWCAPCIEEMPRIAVWRERLAREGALIEPFFVSVDRTAEEVANFRAQHPDAPITARLIDAEGLRPFLDSLGLDSGATIPVHVLVDPEDRIRCVRTGAVIDTDYPAVRAIVRGG